MTNIYIRLVQQTIFILKFYSDSANSYDSMADYYVAKNDFENALEFVIKAYELSGSDYPKQRIQELKEKK